MTQAKRESQTPEEDLDNMADLDQEVEYDGKGRPKRPRTLPCEFCDKLFRRVEHLDRHLRTHTKEKPFLCIVPLCGKSFSRRDLLRRHERINHGDLPPDQLSKPRRPNTKRRSTVASEDSTGSVDQHRSSISMPTPYALNQHQVAQPHIPQDQMQPQVSAHVSQPQITQASLTSMLDVPAVGTMSSSINLGYPTLMGGTHAMDGMSVATGGVHFNDPFPQSATDNNFQPNLFGSVSTVPDTQYLLAPSTMSTIPSHSLATAGLNGNAGGDGVSGLQVLSDMASGQKALNPTTASMIPGAAHVSLPSMESLPPALQTPMFARPRGVDVAEVFDCNPMDGLSSNNNIGFWSYNFSIDETDPIAWAREMASTLNSRFPSRAASPVAEDGSRTLNPFGPLATIEEQFRVPLLRHITPADYDTMEASVLAFSSVLPTGFVFPSRHTLMRYLKGYYDGMNDNLPILHLATLNPASIAPELLLAMAATGAQYRFERNRSYSIWYAAKAVALEQKTRRAMKDVNALLPTRSQYSNHSTLPSPRMGHRQINMNGGDHRNILDTSREPFASNTPDARMETIQALLILYAGGLWNAKAVFDEAKTIQSTLVVLLDEACVGSEPHPPDLNWAEWISLERALRTKTFAYCYLNLSSIAYGTSPVMFFAELKLPLPQSGKLWRAENAQKWEIARRHEPNITLDLQSAFNSIMDSTHSSGSGLVITTLGLYVLAHAIMQQIWLIKQASMRGGAVGSLKGNDISDLANAMRKWEVAYNDRQAARVQEMATLGTDRDSGLGAFPHHMNEAEDNPNHPATQIAHNATSLVRLASVKLYTDSSSGRELDTRNADQLALKLSNYQVGPSNFKPMPRTGNTNRAVFHALWSLSVLAKEGVDFASKTGPYDWSIQHLLCHFESATLLGRWLITLSVTNREKPLDYSEKQLLHMIRVVMYEAGNTDSIDPVLENGEVPINLADPIAPNDGAAMRRLARTVLRLWSRLFRGNQIWEIVGLMGNGLDKYAGLAETVPAGYGGATGNGLRPVDFVT